MTLYSRITFLFAITLLFNVKGQDIDLSFFKEQEKILQDEYQQIISTTDESKIPILQEKFFNHFFEVVKNENSWLYSFDSLKNVGKVHSPNGKMIVYTWNFSKLFGYSDYFGILQYVGKKGKEVQTYRLQMLKETVEDPFLYICDTNKWIGALYYDIVETKYKGTECYTLIGYNLNNVLSNKKVLDAICVGKSGNLRFEPNMFYYHKKVCNRIEFEYAENAQMLLMYKPEMERIVFDHLSPIRPSLEGQYQFYGPDASYDAFYFEDGVWRLESNILIKN